MSGLPFKMAMAGPAGASAGAPGAASPTALGVGTAALAVPYGAPDVVRPAPDRGQARRTLLAACERGVRFIDTAPAYGEAEALVGAALLGA